MVMKRINTTYGMLIHVCLLANYKSGEAAKAKYEESVRKALTAAEQQKRHVRQLVKAIHSERKSFTTVIQPVTETCLFPLVLLIC